MEDMQDIDATRLSNLGKFINTNAHTKRLMGRMADETNRNIDLHTYAYTFFAYTYINLHTHISTHILLFV